MGQFKPMVKMETTEPSVILKLKKGGHVAMNSKSENGHTNMREHCADDEAAESGSAPKKPSMADRRKAMNPNFMKKGGMAKHDDAAQDRAMIKKALAGKKFASGGTIKGNAGKFLNTKVVDGDKTTSAKGTGGVKNGNGGGYAAGGTIEGNAGKFLNTKVVDGDKTDSAKGTKGVKMGNSGGFAKGGNVDWENRPADGTPPGVTNTKTGDVKNGNGGGFKKGGAAKKHFATGGAVDTGRAVAMPKKPVSQPIRNTMQSGTFKKGGKVAQKAGGGKMEDLSRGAYDRSIGPDEDDMDMARSIRSVPSKIVNAAKRMMGKLPDTGAEAGRGFTNPPMARKKGGSAKC